MNIRDFNNKETQLNQIQKYLREGFGFELTVNADRAEAMLATTRTKLDETKNEAERAKLALVAKSLELIVENVSDEEVEAAKVIMAADEIADKVQKMAEDVAKLHVQDLPAIVEAMAGEIGTEQAQAFEVTVNELLVKLSEDLKGAKEGLVNATTIAQGGEIATDMDASMEAPADDLIDLDSSEDEAEAPVDAEDIFGGDDAASGEENPTGRELKAESADFDNALLELKEMSTDGQVSRKDLDALLAQIKG